MASVQIIPPNVNFICKNKTANGASPLSTPANYSSINALRARLAAIDATYYNTARLDSMTVNDMVYAVRLNDDAGTM